MISGRTQLLGIFGDPVAHTLSPKMQNAALEASGIDAIYLPFQIHPEQLESAVKAIRSLNMVGINVTVPHKERIIPLLDEIDATAKLIGAVNTVVNRQGHLVGFNTDAPGFLASLRLDLQVDPRGKYIVIIGAGGACRAAIAAVAGCAALKVTVANRTIEKAEILACEMQGHFPGVEILASGLTESELTADLASADLLVNTTSIGLAGETFPEFVIDLLADSAAVYDMVYADNPTQLAESANRRGLLYADGRGMLVAQGEAAFFKWFGVEPETGLMGSQIIEK